LILDQIVRDKKTYVHEAKRKRPLETLKTDSGIERRSLIDSILSREVAIIAEIKKKSPSGGEMGYGFGLTELASIYEQSGAAGISVLTDEKYFGGKPEDLLDVKRETNLPVLRKDFIIDEYQIYEAKAFGADAILLIVAILTDYQIAKFLNIASELELEVLLESHTRSELEIAINSGAKLLGINNRNLDTLKIDLNTSISLLQMIPDDRIVVSESGISTILDINKLLDAGADAFLIGESLLKSNNPKKKLAELIKKYE